MIRNLFTLCLCAAGIIAHSQENKASFFNTLKNNLTISYESNSQWYLNDSKFGDFEEEEHLRTTNFLRLDYTVSDRLTAGIQLESYAPINLLNNSELYDKDLGLATYYLQYKTKSIDRSTHRERISSALQSANVNLSTQDWFKILIASQGHQVP